MTIREEKIAKNREAYSERNQEPGLIALTQSRHEPRLSREEVGYSEEPASLVAMLHMPNELPWKLEAELVETLGVSDRIPSSKELKQKGNGLAQGLESRSDLASGTAESRALLDASGMAESRALLCYNQDCVWQL